jgi:hypothetical protein
MRVVVYVKYIAGIVVQNLRESAMHVFGIFHHARIVDFVCPCIMQTALKQIHRWVLLIFANANENPRVRLLRSERTPEIGHFLKGFPFRKIQRGTDCEVAVERFRVREHRPNNEKPSERPSKDGSSVPVDWYNCVNSRLYFFLYDPKKLFASGENLIR